MTGCAVILGLLIAAPFFIAAIPVLAGVAIGGFFCFIALPIFAKFIASFFE